MANIWRLALLLIANLFYCVIPINSANVLAVLPSVWKSHYIFGRRLLEQITAQTNQNISVTLISPHALSSEQVELQLPKIREIRIPGLLENWLEMGLSFNVEEMHEKSIMERFTRLIYAGAANVDLLLADKQVRKLLRSGERFDLLLVDLFLSDSLLGLAHYYQIPTVVLSPTGSNAWLDHMLGNPQSSALDPSNFLPYTERMDIWQRIVNTLMGLFEKLTYNFFHMISQQAIYEKHFQPLCQLADMKTAVDLPHYKELSKNLSLVMLNSNAVVQYPRAYLPNMLQIAGVHLHSSLQLSMPKHVQEFIEKAPAGVVYISFGADVRTVDIARDKLDNILDVCAYMQDMRFLLKWELPEFGAVVPDNLLIAEWWPQEAILAHRNVKVFISSCGLMSVMEAVNGITPILAVPIYPEQVATAKRLESHEVAVSIDFDALTYDSLLYSITKLTRNSSYMKRLMQLRTLFHSDYGTPIARASHYFELVMNSSGGDFLKSHAAHLNFIRSELVDVLAILALGIFAIVAVPFLVICCILRKSDYNYTMRERAANSYQLSRKTSDEGHISRSSVSVPEDLSTLTNVNDDGGGDVCFLRKRRLSSTSVSNVSTPSVSSSSGSPRGDITSKQKRATFERHNTQSSHLSD